jgi:hypothetical protein
MESNASVSKMLGAAAIMGGAACQGPPMDHVRYTAAVTPQVI